MFLHKLLLLVFSVVVLEALKKQDCHFNIPQCYFNCLGTIGSQKVYTKQKLHRECIDKCYKFRDSQLMELRKPKHCALKKLCFNRPQCYDDCEKLLTHPAVYYYRINGSKVAFDCHDACNAFEGAQLCNL